MKFKTIPIDHIDIPEVRIRAQHDDEGVAQLAASLRGTGQMEPIVVFAVGDRYVLSDGAHRVEAALARGDKTISAVIHEGSPRDAMVANLAASTNHGRTNPGQVLTVIKVLLEDEGLDSDAIAAATGMKRDHVETYQRIAEASPLVQDALSEGTIGIGAAYEISRLPDHEQQEDLTATQVVFKRPVRDIKATVDEVLHVLDNPPPPPPQPPERRPMLATCSGCQHEFPLADVRTVPLCPTCFGNAYRLAHALVNGPVST